MMRAEEILVQAAGEASNERPWGPVVITGGSVVSLVEFIVVSDDCW